MSDVFGFLNVNKPIGITSHDVVNTLRRELKIKKVGHAGTLDPLASGVLVICLGAATRLSEYAMHTTKGYRATVRLGRVTTTYDAEGDVVAEHDPGHIMRDEVDTALSTFVGDIDQTPPVYSAIKQGGRKLYDLARSGEAVTLTPRRVRVDSLVVTDWSPPVFTLEVVCGAGTYIRSLAHDLGQAVGVGAHLDGLVRTASGAFTLAEAVALDDLLNSAHWQTHLLPPDAALAHIPRIDLDAADTDHVRHGRLPEGKYETDGDIALAYSTEGLLVAVLHADNGRWKPHKVFLGGD